jgi:catechol 2,3-dioxygenase-like lactoylglutathione lyase family enzyme
MTMSQTMNRTATAEPQQDQEQEILLNAQDATATVAVKDLAKARRFYGETLGLKTQEESPNAVTYQAGRTRLLVYPSSFAGTNQATSVTWGVGDDFDAILRGLQAKGVPFEHYDNLPQVTRDGDVHHAEGLKLAWFKDPDGNLHHLISTPKR